MTKSFAINAQDALALAAAAAAEKMARPKTATPAPRKPRTKVQFNVLLDPIARKKFAAVAFAWGTTERELLESFIAQLPDIEVPEVPAPANVRWAKPK